jgi:hypothetical protein
VGNHIPGDGEADPGNLVRIGDDGLGGANGTMKDGAGEHGHQSKGTEGANGETGAPFRPVKDGLARIMDRSEGHFSTWLNLFRINASYRR